MFTVTQPAHVMPLTLVRRTSPLTGKVNEMRMDVSPDALVEWAQGGPDRPLIQKAFPDLSYAEREFIVSGYSEEDWARMFPLPDEDVNPVSVQVGAMLGECED